LNGSNLDRIAAVNFFLSGEPIEIRQQTFSDCTSTVCTVFVYFAGKAGEYAVEVVNLAKQVSNRLTFTVEPLPPPAVTLVAPLLGDGPVVLIKGPQFVYVVGTNFQAPLSVDLFYGSNPAATLSSTSPGQIVGVEPTRLTMLFDFQGRAGKYAIEVTGPDNRRSNRFDFTVVEP
jgi:hypothetical protein